MKGVLPWLVHWARRAGTRDFCPALAALVGQVQNIFYSLFHFNFSPIFPIAYTVKTVCNFPVPSRDVSDQTLPSQD
jgi:hypothetical protein